MNPQQALAQLALELARVANERDQYRAQLETEVPKLRAEIDRLTTEVSQTEPDDVLYEANGGGGPISRTYPVRDA